MIGRLVHTADFARVLATPARSRSTHFAVHHVGTAPSTPKPPHLQASANELSTDKAPPGPVTVDKLLCGWWVGCVVPKRHAKRAVTRSLLKRQIRAAIGRHAAALQPGLWLVRLRAPFAKMQFPSASSAALQSVASDELDRLLLRAVA